MGDTERDWSRDPDVARAMEIFSRTKHEARRRVLEASQPEQDAIQSDLLRREINGLEDGSPRFVRIERNGRSKPDSTVSATEGNTLQNGQA